MASLNENSPENVSSRADNAEDEIDPLADLFSSTLNNDDSSYRLSQYKCRVREETNQETRRRLLLQQQKDKRSSKFNEKRNVEEIKRNDGDGDWLDEEIFIEEDAEEEMEWSSIKKVAWHKRGKFYKDVLMYSEWFIDIPTDFTDKWILVPCPVGKRTLVVSKLTRTTSYSKKGITVAYFKSLLPPRTILDCIWCYQTKSFYVIDVIQWNGMSFKNCQTDFRFYWLNSKFEENPEYSSKSDSNSYPMIKLPRCVCSLSELSGMMNSYPLFPNNSPKLDGLLFYHCETHYYSGYTPLVGWLKAFMVPDAFGIPVSDEYDAEKPDGYTNYKQFISDKEEKRKEYWTNKRSFSKIKMDCSELSEESEPLNQSIDIDVTEDENCSFKIDVSNCTDCISDR